MSKIIVAAVALFSLGAVAIDSQVTEEQLEALIQSGKVKSEPAEMAETESEQAVGDFGGFSCGSCGPWTQKWYQFNGKKWVYRGTTVAYYGYKLYYDGSYYDKETQSTLGRCKAARAADYRCK